ELGGVPAAVLLGAGPAMPALGDRDAAAADSEDAAGDALRLLAGQPDDERGDVVGSAPLALLVGDVGPAGPAGQVLGHGGEGARVDRVHGDAVALALASRDDREGGDAGLGGAVVRLSRVAEDARRRAGVDDPGVDLLAGLGQVAPVADGVAARRERAP